MSKNLVYIGVVVLAVIAVILGYNIYQQQTGVATTPSTQPPARTIEQPSGTQSGNQASTQNIDIDALFKKFPGPNATVAQIQDFRDYIDPLSKETGLITIKDCKADPIVLRVKKGQDFKITNQDSIDHKLTMLGQEVTVKAGATLTRKAPGEIGESGYSCDNAKTGNIGIIHIVQ